MYLGRHNVPRHPRASCCERLAKLGMQSNSQIEAGEAQKPLEDASLCETRPRTIGSIAKYQQKLAANDSSMCFRE